MQNDDHKLTVIDWWAKAIRDIGFPVVVASALLYSLLLQVPELKEALIRFIGVQEKLVNAIDRLTIQQDELSHIIRNNDTIPMLLRNQKEENNGK